MKCANCFKEIIKNSAPHRYCSSCAKERIRTKDNLRSAISRVRDKEVQTKRGLKINSGMEAKFSWPHDIFIPNFNNLFSFKIPFDSSLSKNNMKTFGNGHYFLKKDTRSAKENIINIMQNSGIVWVQTKTYLDILVEKPNLRGDAINYIDTIADAIVRGIGVDDKWFCIGRVDWQINKINPHIFVTVKQDTNSPLLACRRCGRLLPPSLFNKAKICSDCRLS